MIQHIVDFALRQRLAVFAATLALVALGVEAYASLPIEAYPDVGDTQVQVITQWPGHAAEEVERQITLPLEREMNTAPHQSSVRSVSIAGLSVVTATFADGAGDYIARQQALERLADVDLPDGVSPQLGPLASPIAEVMRYQVGSCRERRFPECSAEDMQVEAKPLSELKDLEEWVIEREILRADGVADVASFGGTVKQYQVLLDPGLLAARGLSLDQVERALGRGQRQRWRRRDRDRSRGAERARTGPAVVRSDRGRGDRHARRRAGARARRHTLLRSAMVISGCPWSAPTALPTSTLRSTTVPATGARST